MWYPQQAELKGAMAGLAALVSGGFTEGCLKVDTLLLHHLVARGTAADPLTPLYEAYQEIRHRIMQMKRVLLLHCSSHSLDMLNTYADRVTSGTAEVASAELSVQPRRMYVVAKAEDCSTSLRPHFQQTLWMRQAWIATNRVEYRCPGWIPLQKAAIMDEHLRVDYHNRRLCVLRGGTSVGLVGRAHWHGEAGNVHTQCILCAGELEETCLHVLCDCPATAHTRQAGKERVIALVKKLGGKAAWATRAGSHDWFRLMLGWPDEKQAAAIKENNALQYPMAAEADPWRAVRKVVLAAVLVGVTVSNERDRLFGERMAALKGEDPHMWQAVRRTVAGPAEELSESDPSSCSDDEASSVRRELWERRQRTARARRVGVEPDWAEDIWTKLAEESVVDGAESDRSCTPELQHVE